MTHISPIRYFGGKTRAVKILEQHSPVYLDRMISPFGGGCSYEIYTARKDVQVIACDTYEPLLCYWDYQINEPELLYKAAMDLYPLSDAEHQEIQKNLDQMEYSAEKAACFFALNYSTYNSMGQSASVSRVWDRFNPNMMARILNFHEPNFSVKMSDYQDTIKSNSEDFLYLDPPYDFRKSQNNKYGKQGSHHRDFNHHTLHDLIKDRPNWLMSINDTQLIRDLYADFQIEEISFRYSQSRNPGTELLIKSKK